MKKIVSFMLVLALAFTLFSCNKKSGEIETIANIINESNPTKIVTVVDYTVGDISLVGNYTTQKDSSGKIQFDYEYQKKAIPGVDAGTSSIKTVSGTVYQDAEGKVWTSGSDFVESDATGYLAYSLNLSESRFESYELSEDGSLLTASIAPNKALRVFGTDISAEGNINLEITIGNGYLYYVRISYTAADTGAVVVINTSYDYSNLTLDF